MKGQKISVFLSLDYDSAYMKISNLGSRLVRKKSSNDTLSVLVQCDFWSQVRGLLFLSQGLID